jgi:hypothetical protein
MTNCPPLVEEARMSFAKALVILVVPIQRQHLGALHPRTEVVVNMLRLTENILTMICAAASQLPLSIVGVNQIWLCRVRWFSEDYL